MKIEIPSMFQGRIGVGDYWRGLGINIVISSSLSAASSILALAASSLPLVPLLLGIVVAVASLLFGVAYVGLGVRRLHDLNLSGLWLFVPILIWLPLFVIPKTFFLFGLLAFALVNVGFFIFVSFTPGTKSVNKYGSPMKYDSWLDAFLGNKCNDTNAGLIKQSSEKSKISLNAILVGALANHIASLVVAAISIVYLIAKYHPPLTQESVPATLNLFFSDPVLLTAGLILGSVADILGGYIAAKIAKRSYLLNAFLTSFLCVLLNLSESDKIPFMFTLIGVIGTPILTTIGGYIYSRQSRRKTS